MADRVSDLEKHERVLAEEILGMKQTGHSGLILAKKRRDMEMLKIRLGFLRRQLQMERDGDRNKSFKRAAFHFLDKETFATIERLASEGVFRC